MKDGKYNRKSRQIFPAFSFSYPEAREKIKYAVTQKNQIIKDRAGVSKITIEHSS
jgi:hypothetical protein